MAATFQLSKSITMGGKTFAENRTLSAARSIVGEATLAAALTGTVASAMTSTSTSTTTEPPGGSTSGTLNLTSIAGLAIGDYLDIYWSGVAPNPISGACYGATIEDIAGTAIYFTGGNTWAGGTAFPSNGTTITCMVPTSYPMVFTGANAVGLVMYSDQPATFVWDVATRANTWVKVAPNPTETVLWYTPSDVVNPVTGSNITQIFISHGYNTGTATLRWGALVNP